MVRVGQKLKGLDQVPFRLAGEVKVGGPGFLWITVPIASQGNIPLAGTFLAFLVIQYQFPPHRAEDPTLMYVVGFSYVFDSPQVALTAACAPRISRPRSEAMATKS